ncbi:pepsin/retropepsin-like aspartic protease family protein [Priestia abyssalis]|uniref:hypothetical protein n=1 Tax=Priestia abyssalis TaxID=1221450 RepID=UPI000994E76E|nr:hypothetical protein [Priestia abyssalis]
MNCTYCTQTVNSQTSSKKHGQEYAEYDSIENRGWFTLISIGILPEEHDTIYRVRDVGDSEFVYSKILDELSIGSLKVREFETEIGAMNYGFELDGIIGLDFLLKTKAIIDLDNPSLYTKNS